MLFENILCSRYIQNLTAVAAAMLDPPLSVDNLGNLDCPNH